MKERPILFSAPMVRAILAGNKTQTRRVLKNQPYISSSNPPRFRDTEPGDIFVCPDFWPTDNNNPGRVLVECTSIGCYHCMGQQEFAAKHSPYGVPGERLWVRETWQYADWTEEGEPHIGYAADGKRILIEDYPEAWAKRLEEVWCELSAPKNYDIDNRAADRRWRPNIHMPRWASRVLLEVTGVRVERLQDISERDAVAEGVTAFYCGPAHDVKNPTRWGVEKTPLHESPTDAFCYLWEGISGAGSWDANPWVWVIEFRRIGA